MPTVLRRPAVETKTGLSASEINRRIKAGTFPRQVPLGDHAVGWMEHEVDEWIEARKAERDATAAQRDELGRKLTQARKRAAEKRASEAA